jgi:hypothetical protein
MIQAVEELLMILEDEGNDFVRNVGTALHPDKPDSCKCRGKQQCDLWLNDTPDMCIAITDTLEVRLR